MNRTLSPELLQRIRTHCEGFCEKHGLDHAREDLQDLIEEKASSYLAVSETLHEEDAFLMAKEHFDDPDVLRVRFGGTRPAQAVPAASSPPELAPSLSTGRRLFAAFVASFVIAIALKALLLPFHVCMTVFRPAPGLAWISSLLFNAVQFSLVALSLLALYGALRHWDRAAEAGSRPWFARMPAVLALLLIAGLIVVERLVPTTVWTVNQGLPFVTHGDRGIYILFVTIFGMIASTGRNMVWLWWVDRTPFSNAKVFAAVACAFAATELMSGAFSFLPGLEVVITDSSGSGGAGIELASLSANNLTLYLRPSPPRMLMGAYWSVWGSSFLPRALAVGVAILAHAKVCRPAMRRNAARAQQA